MFSLIHTHQVCVMLRHVLPYVAILVHGGFFFVLVVGARISFFPS